MFQPIRFFFSLLLSSFTLVSFGQSIAYDPRHSYSVDELKSDFQFLRKQLQDLHPNLYLYTPKKNYDQFFDSLFQRIEKPMTGAEFYNLITLCNSKIKDGHTMFLPGEEATSYFNEHGVFFPFYVMISHGKIFVRMNCSSDLSIKEGSEIASINGTPANEIIKVLMARQIRDGNNQTYPSWILKNYFKEYFSFSFGHPEKFSIALLDKNTGRKNLVITSLSKDSIRSYKHRRYENTINDQKEKRGISLEIGERPNTAVLTIKTFDSALLASTYKQDVEPTIRNAFAQIRDKHVNHLIIDLRDNQGGDFEPGRILLSYLIREPIEYLENSDEHQRLLPKKENYTGNVYVLINGGSFSNSAIVCSYLQATRRAIFVGEETGGNKTILSGEPQEIILPVTKIAAEISTQKYLVRNTLNDGHGVLPDHSVTPNIDDIISGRDVAMEFALALIEKAK